MSESPQPEPVTSVRVGDSLVTVLGTAHVSRASADKVRELLATGDYDAVGVELCPSRYHAIVDPDAMARMDLIQVLREGKAPMVTASLALGAYQQRLAEQFGVEPGAEMRAAIEVGREAGLPVLLLDREVGTTLRRAYRNVSWWRRISLLSGLLASVVSHEEVSEEEVERLKEGDILETAFSQFAAQAQDLYQPLIAERDRYMAARLLEEITRGSHQHILAVVGAGHLAGVSQRLHADQGQSLAQLSSEIDALDKIPPPSPWPRLLPWLVVALLLAGFALGFSRSPELGWQLVGDWVLINGGLAALGTLIAGGHLLTVAGAFLAAPITSLNPMVGAGMVTATVETFIRKPSVGDFTRLRSDTTHLRGWWHNRVTRILLVFLLSTLGSVLGTYLAGFRILERLAGG